MYPPGSGYPPTILELSTSCQAAGGLLNFTCNKAIFGSECQLTLTNDLDPDKPVWVGSIGQTTNAKSFAVPGLANGSYKLLADNFENTKEVAITITCGLTEPGPVCTIHLEVTRISAPTSAGGWGEVAFRISGALDSSQYARVLRADDGSFVQAMTTPGNGEYSFAIPPTGIGTELRFTAYEDAALVDTSCRSEVSLKVPAYVEPVDPTPVAPARWEPVGGVLPNPVLLQVEALLTDATGAPRPGLHVQVELWQPAALTAFRAFRATIRTATQYVDAAPYLRAELIAQLRYPTATIFVDGDACLRFSYRYRIADSTGAEPWITRAGARYAVLAALPGATDTMAAYVADGTGRVASVFEEGEATQFLGFPLEVSVLLPKADHVRYAELRYLDAWGEVVEIRPLRLDPSLPAGMLRIPLPDDPPLCATQLEVSVRDDDRTMASTCGKLVPTPPPSTSGLYADPLYGTY